MKVTHINNDLYILAMKPSFSKFNSSTVILENVENMKSSYILVSESINKKQSGLYSVIYRGYPYNFYDIKITNNELKTKIESDRYSYKLVDYTLWLVDKSIDRRKKFNKIKQLV